MTQSPSITSWARLEARTRDADMSASLTAGISDPLWMLARQWQVGEFLGEDAGSPVTARVRLDVAPITRYRAGNATPTDLDASVPLETVVEREPAATAVDARHAAETGQYFLRLLAAHGAGALSGGFVAAYPFRGPTPSATDPAIDAANARRLAVYSGRVPDGASLLEVFGPTPVRELPEQPTVPSDLRSAVLSAADEWVGWCATLLSSADPAASAWDPNRMEYSFALGAHSQTGETILTAQEYDGSRLDWVDLDLRPDATLDTPQSSSIEVHTLLPAPASYVGMPSSRWWEFEDVRVDFGRVDAEPSDLARLLLVEFATTYANDHFVLPVELPIGSVCRITSLVITNTFDEQVLVGPVQEDNWSLFRPAVTGGATRADLLVLAPSVPDTVDGAPVEEVLLLRDEMANLAWGLEQVVAGPAGLPVDRDRHLAEHRSEPPPPETSDLRYLLATPVPDNWIPLLPERAGAQVRLRRGAQQRATNDGTVSDIPPAGVLLGPEGLWLYPEEVPAAGARLTRAWQLTRWHDGSTHLWLGRTKGAGRGPGSSGLRFDVTDQPST